MKCSSTGNRIPLYSDNSDQKRKFSTPIITCFLRHANQGAEAGNGLKEKLHSFKNSLNTMFKNAAKTL
jgi:hypothetical protein